MRIDFRERVTLRSDTAAAGSDTPDYTGAAFAAGVPARVLSVRGSETFRGRQLEAGVEYVVEMQSINSVVPTMRVEVDSGAFSGRNLNVAYVEEMPFANGKPAKLRLYCAEVV